MNKRFDHGMIFVPLLCLLVALLGCIVYSQASGYARQVMASEPVSNAVVEPLPLEPSTQETMVSNLIFNASSPCEPAETTPPVDEWVCPLTDEEVELIALLTMAEAEGESEYGQRLVIDTVLNRMDSEHFPDSVHDVIYQKNQYSSMTGERVARCWVKEELCELVRSELKERTDYDVVFFRTEHYHSFGVPMFQAGAHYFSKYG